MKHLCKEQSCEKCEMHYYIQMHDDCDEGCELYRDMFKPCYLPKMVRMLYKKIIIPYWEWRAERRIKKDELRRMKLGYTEEEWFDMKFK